MSESARITGTKGVYIGKHSNFDPSKPEKSRLEELSLFSLGEDGSDDKFWIEEGYIRVGIAKVEVEFMPLQEVTTTAVTALRRQKDAVLAKAQLEATKIEQQIQTLLAITNEA